MFCSSVNNNLNRHTACCAQLQYTWCLKPLAAVHTSISTQCLKPLVALHTSIGATLWQCAQHSCPTEHALLSVPLSLMFLFACASSDTVGWGGTLLVVMRVPVSCPPAALWCQSHTWLGIWGCHFYPLLHPSSAPCSITWIVSDSRLKDSAASTIIFCWGCS